MTRYSVVLTGPRMRLEVIHTTSLAAAKSVRYWHELRGPKYQASIHTETRGEGEMPVTLPPLHARVRLVHEVWRYPHFIAEKGLEGVVTESSDDVVAVRMDEAIDGAQDWNNEVHWYPCDGDEPMRDLETA